MSKVVNVFEVESLYNAIQEIGQVKSETFDLCDEGINKARETLEETQREEQISSGMLEAARAVEMACHARLIALEARLAKAAAELAAASAPPPNPIAMAAAGAEIAEIEPQLIQAREEYQEAVRHREALERRYEMAVKCVNLAQERLETLNMKYEMGRRSIELLAEKGCLRMDMAYKDLTKYISRISPEVRTEVETWFNKKSKDREVVKPNEVRDRLDVSNPVLDALLEYLYITDMGFRVSVDNYCNEMKSGQVAGAELKIRKNMVGRLCEELVINAFKPISSKVVTQQREALPDGSYTKVDMIVYGLTNPLVLGRGKGMGAREGGSLAVEVKSGHSSYLYSQLNHLLSQAIGHSSSDVSCVICTRDIHNLPPEKEKELREKLKEAGSPIIGMLPLKDEVDSRCINFVKEKMKDV